MTYQVLICGMPYIKVIDFLLSLLRSDSWRRTQGQIEANSAWNRFSSRCQELLPSRNTGTSQQSGRLYSWWKELWESKTASLTFRTSLNPSFVCSTYQKSSKFLFVFPTLQQMFEQSNRSFVEDDVLGPLEDDRKRELVNSLIFQDIWQVSAVDWWEEVRSFWILGPPKQQTVRLSPQLSWNCSPTISKIFFLGCAGVMMIILAFLGVQSVVRSFFSFFLN